MPHSVVAYSDDQLRISENIEDSDSHISKSKLNASYSASLFLQFSFSKVKE